MKYKITYKDPETEEIKEHIGEYFDSVDLNISGKNNLSPRITARMWVDDHAYSLADKGWYEIEEMETREQAYERQREKLAGRMKEEYNT